MTTKNKKLEIAAGIVGGIYALFHVVLAIVVIVMIATAGEVNWAGMGILVVVMYPIVKFLMFAIPVLLMTVAVVCIALVLLPLRFNSPSSLRKIAVTTIVLLVIRMLFDVNFVFGFIVNGFRDGDYLLAILTVALVLLTIAWFILNVIKAIIYKKDGRNNE